MIEEKSIERLESIRGIVVLIALTGVWTALVLVCSLIPIYPVPGTSTIITLSTALSSAMTPPLLGPLWGTISGLIFGSLVPYVYPPASIGILTFLAPTIGALMGGLVLFGKWKEALLILIAQMVIWFSHPFAWYQNMPIITWQYWVVLALIVVPPVRKGIVRSIRQAKPATLTFALWAIAWISHIGGENITGNNIAVWVNGWGIPELYVYWAPATLYYAIADTLACIAGAIIGAAVLLSLKRANIKATALDFFQAE